MYEASDYVVKCAFPIVIVSIIADSIMAAKVSLLFASSDIALVMTTLPFGLPFGIHVANWIRSLQKDGT